MSRRTIRTVLFSIFGLFLVFVALFAPWLGLDRNAGWGRGRIAALILGLGITLGTIYFYRFENKLSRLQQVGQSFLQHSPLITALQRNQRLKEIGRLWQTYRFTFPYAVAIILFYIWFVSAGTWTTWISPTRYYADLARGFARGHLYLPTRVDPDLLELADPYDPATRGQVEAPLDITFYQGKYYLYWGPTPALIAGGIQLFYGGRVGDLFLVFGFVCGIFLSQHFLLITIWDRFFARLPKWLLPIAILLAGLAGPTMFMLDHVNSARIYEAAITGGQFFLMGGLLVILSTPGGFSSNWRLALTGTLWALAFATRFTLIVPIGLVTLAIAFQVLRSNNSLSGRATRLFALSAPLVLGIICLGWYNWARFGSVTETGYYYQLASPYLQKYYDILFDPAYIVQNLYNYLFHPFQTHSKFPFLYPSLGKTEPIFPFYSFPQLYSAQVITGVLCTVPFAVFAAIPPGMAAYGRFRSKPHERVAERSLTAITLILGTASLFAFGMLLFFFWAGMRYLEDFMPALIILSIIGFWQGYEALATHPNWRNLYTLAGIVLAGASILVSLLIALSVNDARFALARLFG